MLQHAHHHDGNHEQYAHQDQRGCERVAIRWREVKHEQVRVDGRSSEIHHHSAQGCQQTKGYERPFQGTRGTRVMRVVCWHTLLLRDGDCLPFPLVCFYVLGKRAERERGNASITTRRTPLSDSSLCPKALLLQGHFPLHLAHHLIIDLALASQPDHGGTFSLNDLAVEPPVGGHLLFVRLVGFLHVLRGHAGLLLAVRPQVLKPRLPEPSLARQPPYLS